MDSGSHQDKALILKNKNDKFLKLGDFSLYMAYHFLFYKKKKIKAFIGDQTRDLLHGQHNFLGRLRISKCFLEYICPSISDLI